MRRFGPSSGPLLNYRNRINGEAPPQRLPDKRKEIQSSTSNKPGKLNWNGPNSRCNHGGVGILIIVPVLAATLVTLRTNPLEHAIPDETGNYWEETITVRWSLFWSEKEDGAGRDRPAPGWTYEASLAYSNIPADTNISFPGTLYTYANFLERIFSSCGVGFANSSGLGYIYSIHPSPLVLAISMSSLTKIFHQGASIRESSFRPMPDVVAE